MKLRTRSFLSESALDLALFAVATFILFVVLFSLFGNPARHGPEERGAPGFEVLTQPRDSARGE